MPLSDSKTIQDDSPRLLSLRDSFYQRTYHDMAVASSFKSGPLRVC